MPTTQAQQYLGTGGMNLHRVAERAQQSYNQAYGGLPTPKAIEARDSGQLPPPAAQQQQQLTVGSSPPPMPGTPPGPGLAPEMASVAEAEMPGFHTGNPNSGIPAREAGFAPTPGTQAAQPGIGQAVQGQAPQPAPGMRGDPARTPQPLGVPPSPQPQIATVADAAQAAYGSAPPPAPVMPAMPTVAAAQGTAATQGNAPESAAPTGQASVTPEGFTGKNGNEKSWSDVTWDVARNQGIEWQSYVQYSDNPAEGFFNRLGINKPGDAKDPPSVTDYTSSTPEKHITEWDTAGASFGDDQHPNYIKNDYLRSIAIKMAAKAEALNNHLKSQKTNPGLELELQEILNQGQAVLARYGIHYNPRGTGTGQPADPPPAAPPPPITDTGDGSGAQPTNPPPAPVTPPPGTTPPPTTPGGDNYDPYAGGGGPGNQPPGIGDDRSDRDVGDTDIATKLQFARSSGELRSALKGLGIDIDKLEDTALLEFMGTMGLKENDLVNQQKGINIQQQAYENTLAANNPLRQSAEAAAQSLYDNPDPVDWDPIRNREASDIAKASQQEEQAWSASAGRRSLDLGALAGQASNLRSDQANLTARRMSELTEQEQRSQRAGLLQAMVAGGDVDRTYRGAENSELQRLANMVAGFQSVPGSPYEGLTNTAAGLQATQIGYDAQKDAEDAARRQGLFGLGGALIGAGGQYLGAK